MSVEICVVMPTYNRESYLREAIDSILNQTVKPGDIFICDDGSTDNTQSVLRSYGEKIRWVTIQNSGPAMARKIAIENTTAPWVALCDSDDVWMPDHLERLMGAIGLWPETDVVSSNFEHFNAQGSFGVSKFHTAPPGWWEEFTTKTDAEYQSFDANAYPALLQFQPVFTTSQMFRRRLYTQVGGIDRAMARMVSEDAHLTLRMAARGVVVFDCKITAKIRRHAENFSGDSIKVAEGDIGVLRHLVENGLIPDRFTACTVKDIARRKADLFNNYFWMRDFQKARAAVGDVPPDRRDVMFYIRAIIAFAAIGIGK